MMKLPSKEVLRYSRVVSPWIDSGEWLDDGNVKIFFKKGTPKGVIDTFEELRHVHPKYTQYEIKEK